MAVRELQIRKILTWIHTAVSEKPEFTDGQMDGRTDACAGTVALLTMSSRAKNELLMFIGCTRIARP